MQILQLCKKFPFPIKDGESLAVTYLAQGLQKLGHEITLLAMNTTKHPVAVNRIRPQISHYKAVHYTSLDNELKPLHAFLNLFSSDSYNISRFDNSLYREKLASLLSRHHFDVIQLESLYLTPYINEIRKLTQAPIVLRAHNVEHEIWERMALNEQVAIRRWYFEYTAKKLKKYEIEQLQHIDLLLPISPVDHQKFQKLGYKGHSLPVPIGVDVDDFPYREIDEHQDLSLSFIGSLDWMPNLEGINWFLEQIWPSLIAVFPNLRLHIAGRNCPDWLKSIQMPGVVVEGEVEDSRSFLLQHPLTIVPLLSGSGMRAKIVEAMALGRVVISTELGLEGIPVRDKTEVLVANTVEEFIRKFAFCYHHRKHLNHLSSHARKFVEQRYSHIEIGREVSDVFGKLQWEKKLPVSHLIS